MNGLEIALITLVVIWSVIFLVIALALIVLFWQVKKGIDRVNRILENTENITQNIASPISKAVAGVAFLKEAFGSIVKVKRSNTKKVKIVKK